MADYQEFLNSINREAYHEGEWQWQEDGYTVTRTYQYSPPGCHDSCGVLFYTKDGKLEKVEGDPLSPWVNGRLCIRCLDLPEAVNHPDRVKYPMKRAGERGENKWERISWDEAYATIVEKVNEIKATHGSESIICVHGTGRNINWLCPFFGQAALQTPNISTLFFSGFSCYLPRVCGAMAPLGDFPIADAAVGHADRYANPNWRAPEVVVVWGNEPLASNADGYMGHWLVQCVQMGTRIISIDPRLTWWGARADYWLQLRPGTDAAIACAWINVIISEELYDREFIEYWCSGFDELWEGVKDFTPAWAADISGVPEEEIIASARLYASGNNSAIQWGLAFDQQVSAMALNLATCDLMAICGNIDRPGGNILVRNSFEINAGYASGEDWTPQSAKDRKLTIARGRGISGGEFIAHADTDGILHAIEAGTNAAGDPYPIDMIWFQSSNSLACPAMDAPRAWEALKKVPFIVNADPFLTPLSIAAADIILPVAMSCERNSARTWWTPVRTMYKVSEYYEAKSDEQIVVELGRLLNPAAFEQLGWEKDTDITDWYLAGGDGKRHSASSNVKGNISEKATGGVGISFQELSKQGGYKYDSWNDTYEKFAKGMLRDDGQVGFSTPSGRIELAPYTYRVWGLTPTPFHVEPPEGPISTPELMQEYPLILSCGGRSYEFFHSEHRQLPTMRELHPWPLLMVHPIDAEKYGVEEGRWAWIENFHGRFRQVVQLTERVAPGVVHAEHGWWFPEQEGAEPSLFGTFDSNPNNCTRAYDTGEGGIGAPIKSMICKIYPYAEGDELPGVKVVNKGGWKDYVEGKMVGSTIHGR
ncbi:MAG: molybdopterin-dependent oxidoreductase [Coriobacteriales bacterium]|nr:molybdopterin-dependent oxidoreductase [Coriobacteriales bacterium]